MLLHLLAREQLQYSGNITRRENPVVLMVGKQIGKCGNFREIQWKMYIL